MEDTSQVVLGSSDWPPEGTSQPVTISKKWKKPQLWKRTWLQALLWFPTSSLGLPASGTDLKSTKGLYSSPSPIPKEFGCFFPKREKEKEIWYVYCTRQPSTGGVGLDNRAHGNAEHPLQLSLFLRLLLVRWLQKNCLVGDKFWRSIAALVTFVSIFWGLRTHHSGRADW
jgi:hypothetical protein